VKIHKSLLLIFVLSLSLILLAPTPDTFTMYINTTEPAGEVVFHISGDDEYYCLCKQNEVPTDAVVLNKIYSRTEPGLFHTWKEIEQELKELAEKYPERCEFRTIGHTHENRPIHALRFYPGKPSPGFLFIGTHHAREWMSAEIPLELCHYLAENYDNDPRVDRWLESFDIWIIPMLNPDGHQYTVDFDRMWRKNRKPLIIGYGVDPNRNYGYMWGGDGSSGDPTSEIYRGESPFSELETQVIRDLSEKIPFIGCLTYHTFGDLVLYPWGYHDSRSAWNNELEGIAIGLAEKTGPPDDDDNKKKSIPYADKYDYLPMRSASFYVASGDCTDYLYSQHGTAAYTIEIGDRQTGFTPGDDLIEPTIEQILDMNFFFLERVPEVFCIVQGYVKNAIGKVPDAHIYLGKSGLELTPDPVTGYYHRIIPPGRHVLKAEWTVDETQREIVDFVKGINHLDITWIREEGLSISGAVVNESGEPASTTISLVDENKNVVAKKYFSDQYSFEELTKGRYQLIVDQIETGPKTLDVNVVWDITVNLTVANTGTCW
jgi:carboxypeptidase T